MPVLQTWYLISNLSTAPLAHLVRLYALRMWVEQSYKQVKHALGWAQYQVRSDLAIRRHWMLVWCAFTFCWWQAALQGAMALPTSPVETISSASSLKKTSDPILAPSFTSSQVFSRTLPHAQALLASLFSIVPTTVIAAPP